VPDIIGLVHSSDLHIGRYPANDRFNSAPLLRYGNAHSLLLGRGLVDAMDDVAAVCQLASPQSLFHVMSGDLTATGHAKEFLVAHTYLRSFWRQTRSPETATGLNLNDPLAHQSPRLATVSGNHDQWRGQSFVKNVGYNPSLSGTHFRKTFWCRTWRSNRLELELYGLDSSAGLSTTKGTWSQPGRLDLSKGGDVARLEQHLKKNPLRPLPAGILGRARALVLHHSLASGGGLEAASQQQLLALAAAHGFAAILTGHTHDFLDNPMVVKLPGGGHRQIHELRSASATQGPEKRTPAPGFLAYQIAIDGTQIRWKAWRFLWNPMAQSFAVWQPDRKKPFADFITP
jgi:Calcineurin-like phosphoesterase